MDLVCKTFKHITLKIELLLLFCLEFQEMSNSTKFFINRTWPNLMSVTHL